MYAHSACPTHYDNYKSYARTSGRLFATVKESEVSVSSLLVFRVIIIAVPAVYSR